jgi:hypothetical protein
MNTDVETPSAESLEYSRALSDVISRAHTRRAGTHSTREAERFPVRRFDDHVAKCLVQSGVDFNTELKFPDIVDVTVMMPHPYRRIDLPLKNSGVQSAADVRPA